MEEKKGGDPKPQVVAMPVAFKPSGFVPPPPKGRLIPHPSGPNSNVQTPYPISNGPAPWMMSLPGIESEPKPEMPEGVPADGQGGAGGAPIDDGFTPEQRRKMQLEEDPGFKTYLRMKRMGIPLINVRRKMVAEGKGYSIKDLDMFADKEEIEIADACII